MKGSRPIATDLPPAAGRMFAVLVAASGAVAVLLVLSLGVGSVALNPAEVVLALLSQPVEDFHAHIVTGLRLPRALIAGVAGAMLGLAGAILQTSTRNDLADPSLVGVTGGGVFAVVATLFAFRLDQLPHPWSGVIALVGALAAGALVYALAWRQGTRSTRLVLDGVLVGAVLSSAVSVMLLFNGALFGVVLRWVVGSLNGRVWEDWAGLWPWAIAGGGLALLSARSISALWIGEDVATVTGARAQRARLLTFATAAILTAGAVSTVGAIGFIGLLAPHISRLIVGSHPNRVLPLAVLVGAGLLLSADLLAELLSTVIGGESIGNRARLPAGAVTALLGGPLLLWLLTRRRT